VTTYAALHDGLVGGREHPSSAGPWALLRREAMRASGEERYRRRNRTRCVPFFIVLKVAPHFRQALKHGRGYACGRLLPIR